MERKKLCCDGCGITCQFANSVLFLSFRNFQIENTSLFLSLPITFIGPLKV